LRRQLKTLAGSTGQARDTEVQIAWLKPQEEHLNLRHKAGLHWLIENLESRQTVDQTASLQKLAKEFEGFRKKLTAKLSVCEIRLDTQDNRKQPSFLAVTGILIGRHSSQLRQSLATIQTVADDVAIHRSRISVKRLRYILEPLRKEIAGAKPLVKQLKALQDVLGDLHDAKVLENEIALAFEKSAVEQARRFQEMALENEPLPTSNQAGDDWKERHGLLELIRILKETSNRLFGQLEAQYLGENGSGFFGSVEELARKLGSHPGDIEPHRRYVLDRLPDRVKGEPSALIDEGWLPGKAIPEILRRVRFQRRLAFYRLLLPKARRRRVEERISRRLFETLWPLTERRRLRRRRYEIFDGTLKWQVSQFADRDLILAEVELTLEETEFSLPDWLADHVKRDVTGEKRYESASLAARRPRRPIQQQQKS
jgi:CHAD domain-containing protein/CYTH domain-containing protein